MKMGSLAVSSNNRILSNTWRTVFSDDMNASKNEKELINRIRSICECKFHKYDKMYIKANISEGDKFEFYNETRSQFYDIIDLRDFSYYFNNKKNLGLNENSLSLDIHPLFLINPEELPDQLLQQCFSTEHSNEFYSEMQNWIEQHFNIIIKDNESFQDNLIFFMEIWKHPKMIKRVQNFLFEKIILQTKDSVTKLKSELKGATTDPFRGTIMTSPQAANTIKKAMHRLSHAEKFWFRGNPGSFSSVTLQSLCVTAFTIIFSLNILRPLKIGLEYLTLFYVIIFIVAFPIIIYVNNTSIKEKDIYYLKEIKDVEAIKIVFEASDAVAKKNQWLFSKWIPSFLSLRPSLSQRVANIEKYAKEHDINYISDPYQMLDTKTLPKSSIGNYIFSKRFLAASMAVGVVAALYHTNVLHNAASWISSLWADPSKTFPSQNSTPEKLTSGITSYAPNLSEAVNSCISKYGPAITITYEKAKKVFKCFNPLSSSDNTRTWDLVKKIYREFAKFAHPDRGGSHENMLILNAAKDVLQKGLKKR